MLRLGDLAESAAPLLRWPGTSTAAADRVVERVVRCPGGLPDGPTRRALAVISTDDLAQLAGRALADAGAVVAVGPGDVPEEVRGIPVLRPAGPDTGVEEVAYRLLTAVAAESLRVGQGIERLFDLHSRGMREGQGPDPMLRWVEEKCPEGSEARALVVAGAERREWPAELHERAGDVAALVEGREREMLRWRARPQRRGREGRWVQVWPVGAAAPYSLLVLLRYGPEWSGQQQQRLAHVASLTGSLVREAGVAGREALVREASHVVRRSGVQALLAGDAEVAGRILEPVAPELLGAGEVEVALMATAEEGDLPGLFAEAERVLEGARALTVRPEGEGMEEGSRRVLVLYGGGQAALQDVLEPVTAQWPGVVIGVSALGPLEDVPDLYDGAVQMLDGAGFAPGRIAVDAGRRELAERLSYEARAWAREVLAPVERLPEAERQQMLVTARTAVELGITETARVLGVHRHTVSSRAHGLARMVGFDRQSMADRCAGDLMLRLAALPAPPAGTQPAASAAAVLREPAAQEWGRGARGTLADTAGDPGRLDTARHEQPGRCC